jgi:DNA-binding transcriptional MerR regulator
MSIVFRRNRKSSDRQILRLNSLGLSLSAIGTMLDCHPTSITLRLKSLKVTPVDTRRAFMEDIYTKLPEEFKEAIADLLEECKLLSIKDYVRSLIATDITARHTTMSIPEHLEAHD